MVDGSGGLGEKPIGDLTHVDNAHMVGEIDRAFERGEPVQMKSTMDRISVWQAVKTYRRVSMICMAAAFSASVDGYREFLPLNKGKEGHPRGNSEAGEWRRALQRCGQGREDSL